MRYKPALLLILLLAFALRIERLAEIPPGLTHDEANHGREALGILDGNYQVIFPLNYGSEPLYSYTVAGVMGLVGENLPALRLVNVWFSLLTIAVTYRWAVRVFDPRMALLGAALLSASFWPLASSREALRAGMLPFFMAAAAWFFWQMVTAPGKGAIALRAARWSCIAFALCVAATLHIYLAARVAWLLFPLYLLYLALAHRPLFQRTWRPVVIGLVTAALLVTPFFVYQHNHPELLTRLDMLDRPLQQLRAGDFGPLLRNVSEALLAFVWPGYGDHFLAYNIPGRPVFEAVTAVFFILGILVCLGRWRRPAYAFLLLWFGVGILPSLITGPTANTTRNLAALPAVYLLPAVGFMAAGNWLSGRFGRAGRPALAAAAGLWLLVAGSVSARDYFVRWGESADVRGAYQHTLVEMLAYWRGVGDGRSPLVISTVYPNIAHDPSIGLLLGPQPTATRWVDARYALLWPQGRAAPGLIPASTPPHAALAQFLHPIDNVTLRPDDLDPSFTHYALSAVPPVWLAAGERVNFDNAVQLLQARWLRSSVAPGETAELLTVWQVIDPARVGPRVLPLYTTDVVLFTQVLTPEGGILTQRDSLEAPSWQWQAGDIIIQIHPVLVPAEAPPGEYLTIVGLYDRHSQERRPVVAENGEAGNNYAYAPLLSVTSTGSR